VAAKYSPEGENATPQTGLLRLIVLISLLEAEISQTLIVLSKDPVKKTSGLVGWGAIEVIQSPCPTRVDLRC
jgi:hypothetical protein